MQQPAYTQKTFQPLQVYLQNELVDKVKLAAASEGDKVSHWVRRLIVKRLRELEAGTKPK